MRILHITKGSTGGLDFISKELFEYLKQSHEQKVFYFEREGGDIYSRLDSMRIPALRFKEEIIFANLFFKVRELFRADLIHVHHAKAWLLFSPLCFFGRKNIFTFHMTFGSGVKRGILARFFITLIISYCTLFSKKMIFLTRGQKVELKKFSMFKKLFEKRSTILPNFIDGNKILVQKNTINKNVLFVGRYTKIKGYSDFLALSREIKDFSFFSIGENSSSKEQADPNLVDLGNIPHDKIFDFYDKCTFLILPSYTEAFPLVVLEAMARGLVILISDIPGMRDIVEDGRNGFLFPAGDISRMKRALAVLRDSPDLVRNIVHNNLVDVQKYEKSLILKGYEKLYAK